MNLSMFTLEKKIATSGKEKKTKYVENLHENVTKSDLVELFGLRTTNI